MGIAGVYTTFDTACRTAFGISNATHSGYPGLLERLATNTDTVWGAALLIPLWRGRRFMRLDAAENVRT
jgi:hypothetical protein